MSIKLQDNTACIIVVDDNDDEIFITTTYLKRSRLTNPVLTFTKGTDFLAYLEDVKKGAHPVPAIVLLDIRMPLMNGFQVLTHVRRDPFFKDSPAIVMYSNSDDEDDIKTALDLGADAYQVKPSGKDEYLRFFNSFVD